MRSGIRGLGQHRSLSVEQGVDRWPILICSRVDISESLRPPSTYLTNLRYSPVTLMARPLDACSGVPGLVWGVVMWSHRMRTRGVVDRFMTKGEDEIVELRVEQNETEEGGGGRRKIEDAG